MGRFLFDSCFRNSAKNVNAKLQAERMNVIRERLEAGTVIRGRKTIDRRGIPSMVVQAELRFRRVPCRQRIGDKPFHVDDDILPAARLQMIG